jgi:hypothetical protein
MWGEVVNLDFGDDVAHLQGAPRNSRLSAPNSTSRAAYPGLILRSALSLCARERTTGPNHPVQRT